MSDLTEKIRDLLDRTWEQDFDEQAQAVLAVVREELLSDRATNAAAEAMYPPSDWHGASPEARIGMRSHAWQGLRAALDAVMSQEANQ